ncbi:hypothetical protein [Spirosoma litoris]
MSRYSFARKRSESIASADRRSESTAPADRQGEFQEIVWAFKQQLVFD